MQIGSTGLPGINDWASATDHQLEEYNWHVYPRGLSTTGRETSFLGCQIISTDKDLASDSEHDVSERRHHTHMISVSYAASYIRPSIIPSCKCCNPYSSSHEWKGMEPCVCWGWTWLHDWVFQNTAQCNQKTYVAKLCAENSASQPILRLSQVAHCGHIIDIVTTFKMLESVLAIELGMQLRDDI